MPPTRRSSEGAGWTVQSTGPAGRQSVTSARRSGRARGGVRPERRWLRPAGCYPPGTSFTPSDRCGGEGKKESRTSSDPATGTAFASPRKRDCSRSPSPRSARGRTDTRSRRPRPWPSPPSPRFCGRRRKRPGWSDSSSSMWKRSEHTGRPSISCEGLPRLDLSEEMAHDAHVDDALRFAVYPQQVVHLVVEEGGHLAASKPEPDGRQRQILRDVPRVEVDVPVGPLAVFPLRALEDGRPDERGGGLGAELLEQGTGGGDGSELMAPLLPLDARGGPQEKGDLLQAKRPGGVLPDASPQGQDLHEREADRRSRQGKPDDLRAGIFLVQGRPGGPVDPPSPQPSALVFRFLLKPVSDSFGFLHGGVTPIRIPFR